ncbi:hypothetical protein EH223_00485 [candidate division KSB1 bacterium]|nr:tetratricopeptide repeat protein [candidate division KSB1 bacterium]RQW07127.1 MAG: hypothetical protein EH223_00485 [candidate division KSB1 bacterium]
MKSKIAQFAKRCSIFCLMAMMFASCADKGERKIKLANQPMTGLLMQDEVETIEIAAEKKKKVALLEFQNVSKESAADWLKNGIKQKIDVVLAQSRQLNLSPSRFVNDALASLNLSEADLDNERASSRLARELNANVLIRGKYYFQRDVLHIDVELRSGEDGRLIRQFSHVSTAADTMAALRTIISEMSFELRSELEDRPKGPPEVETSNTLVSTTSTEAFRLYIEGIKKIEHFYMQEALPLLSKAVELDTTFATAYYNLGYALLSLKEFDKALPIMRTAATYAENLSDRERLPILAMNALLSGEFYQAIELYNQVVELYPEDDGVHYELGNFYFSVARNYHKAIERYETTIELNPKHKMAYNQLAYSYALIGELDYAIHSLEKYAELAPDEPNPYDSYGEILQREGRLKDAIEMYKNALDIKSDFWHSRLSLAAAYQDLGRTLKAERLLREIKADTLSKEYLDMTTRLLARNELVAGHPEKARKILDDALLKDSDNLYYMITLLKLEPQSEKFQGYFTQEIQHQIDVAQRDSLKYEKLLNTVSSALSLNLGLDLVDELLDISLKSSTDPILFQSAAGYKLILDFLNGRSTDNIKKLFAQGSDPETFKYIPPASWNAYWRHYFRALRSANGNGIPVRQWADSFYEFSRASHNRHFELNSSIAVAAADYFSGDTTNAQQRLSQAGFPCEGNWKFVGPFNVKRGFHQKFWPENENVEEWSTKNKYRQALFQKRDKLFDGYVDVKEIVRPSMNQAVYALLEINSKNFQQIQLRFGVNGRLKVWLNNKSVLTKNVHEAALLDHYIASVKLHIGANYLLVRVDNTIGELGFYCRITDKNGDCNTDIEFYPPKLMASMNKPAEKGS